MNSDNKAAWQALDTVQAYLQHLKSQLSLISCHWLHDGECLRLPLKQVYVPIKFSLDAHCLAEADIDHTYIRTSGAPHWFYDDAQDIQDKDSEKQNLIGSNLYTERGLSLKQLWQHGRQWTVLAPSGAGKSTLLQHTCLQACEAALSGSSRACLPISLDLAALACCWQKHPEWTIKQALLTYILDDIKNISCVWHTDNAVKIQQQHTFSRMLKQVLQQGKVLILLDAWDQVQPDAMRQRCKLALLSFFRQFPENRSLLVSRGVTYQPTVLAHYFKPVRLETFNTHQSHHFFQQWINALDSESTLDTHLRERSIKQLAQLQNKLEAQPELLNQLHSPLLCSLLVSIQHQVQKPLSHPLNLYRIYIDNFIKYGLLQVQEKQRADALAQKKDVPLGRLNSLEARRMIEDIALSLHQQGAESIQDNETILEIACNSVLRNGGIKLEQAQAKAEQLQLLLKQKNSLLSLNQNGQSVFFHLNFQEYLAACAVQRSPQQVHHFLQHSIFDPYWHGVLSMLTMLQGLNNPLRGGLFVTLLQRYPHQHEAIMHYSFRQALSNLADAQASEPLIEQLFQTALHLYLNCPALQPAFNHLLKFFRGHVHQAQHLTSVYKLLGHTNPEVRAKTIELLGNLAYKHALPRLFERLQKDPHPLVRGKAAEALGQYAQDSRSCQALLDSLNQDKALFVRQYAAHSLRLRQDKGFVDNLLAQLDNKSNLIRARTTAALGYIQDPSSLQVLSDLLQNDPHSTVRWRAAEAIGLFQDNDMIDVLLHSAEHDKNTIVRSRAIAALSYSSQAHIHDAILTALQDDRYPAVRWRAAEALGKLQLPNALLRLLSTLQKDTDNGVRWSAAQALGKLGDARAIDGLSAAVQHDIDPSVRWSAVEALGRLESKETVQILLRVLSRDPYAAVRSKACQALGYTHDNIAISPLLSALSHAPEASVRSHAATALGYLRAEESITPLITCLEKDKEPLVRAYAIDALAMLQDPQPIPILMKLIENDPEITVRWRAARALELLDLGYLI